MKRRTFLQLIGLSAVPGAMQLGRVVAPTENPRVVGNLTFVSCGLPSAPFTVTSGTWLGNAERSLVMLPGGEWFFKEGT
mgnify:CR=1 FL=1